MMIGKPTDVGALQSALRTGDVATRSTEAARASDGKVESVQSIDSVKLSDTSRSLSAAAGTLDGFRADKVAEIKQAIEQGTYQVKARVVADRMISEAADLLRSMTTSA